MRVLLLLTALGLAGCADTFATRETWALREVQTDMTTAAWP